MKPAQGHFRNQSYLPSSASSISGFSTSSVVSRNSQALRSSQKYGGIKSVIDSGLNMRKLSEKFPEAKINARYKKEELFRRIKNSTLIKLLNEKQIDCLILDVRDREDFQACHMKGAISYPAPLLRRSVNIFSVDILSFINKEPKKIIIIYDEDEHLAVHAGNLFVEKGVENIFMLAGGLREISLKYPEMIEGIFMRCIKSCPTTPLNRTNKTRFKV